jgi:hypothetical protein
MGGSCLDVSAAFAVRACACTPSALLAAQAIEISFDLAGYKIFTDLNFVAALPPTRVQRIRWRLSDGFGVTTLLSEFSLILI